MKKSAQFIIMISIIQYQLSFIHCVKIKKVLNKIVFYF